MNGHVYALIGKGPMADRYNLLCIHKYYVEYDYDTQKLPLICPLLNMTL